MTNAELVLTCPKCQGSMRAYERNGITIDQCSDCRGVFLDRGELERLIDAEGQRYEEATSGRGRDDDYYDDRSSRGGHGSGHGSSHGSGHGSGSGNPRKKKRGGFLENLFD